MLKTHFYTFVSKKSVWEAGESENNENRKEALRGCKGLLRLHIFPSVGIYFIHSLRYLNATIET